MQSPNQINWNNQNHPQQYTYYQQQPAHIPQPLIYQQQYQPILMAVPSSTTSTATSPSPISMTQYYTPNTYYSYPPMMVAGGQQMIPRVFYVQPIEEQIASQSPMVAGSTVVTVTSTADKIIAGELSPAPKSSSSKIQSTIKINKIDFADTDVNNEQLQNRLQSLAIQTKQDMNAEWDGNIYCITSDQITIPYDLILKIWFNITSVVKCFRFYLVHKKYVLDGAFRSRKLQNVIGFGRTEQTLDIEIEAQSLVMNYISDIVLYMYTGSISTERSDILHSPSALVSLYTLAQGFSINSNLAMELHSKIKHNFISDVQCIVDIYLQCKELKMRNLTLDAMDIMFDNWENIPLEKYKLLNVSTIAELNQLTIEHVRKMKNSGASSGIILRYLKAYENETKHVKCAIVEELMAEENIDWTYFGIHQCFEFIKICDDLYDEHSLRWRQKNLRLYQRFLSEIQVNYQPFDNEFDVFLKGMEVCTWTEVLVHASDLSEIYALQIAINKYKEQNSELVVDYFTCEYIFDQRKKYEKQKNEILPELSVLPLPPPPPTITDRFAERAVRHLIADMDGSVVDYATTVADTVTVYGSDNGSNGERVHEYSDGLSHIPSYYPSTLPTYIKHGYYPSNIPPRRVAAALKHKKSKESLFLPSLPPLPSYESSKHVCAHHSPEMPHIIDPRTPEINAVDDKNCPCSKKRFTLLSTDSVNASTDVQPKRNSAKLDGAHCVQCRVWRHKFGFTKSQWRNRPREFRRCKWCTGEIGTDSKAVPLQHRASCTNEQKQEKSKKSSRGIEERNVRNVTGNSNNGSGRSVDGSSASVVHHQSMRFVNYPLLNDRKINRK